jgi:hypothetical protein
VAVLFVLFPYAVHGCLFYMFSQISHIQAECFHYDRHELLKQGAHEAKEEEEKKEEVKEDAMKDDGTKKDGSAKDGHSKQRRRHHHSHPPISKDVQQNIETELARSITTFVSFVFLSFVTWQEEL